MDSKKKRNKKKKGNQTKNLDESISNTEETIIQDQNNNSNIAQPIHNAQVSVSKEAIVPLDQDKESVVKQENQSAKVSVAPLDHDKEVEVKQPVHSVSVSADLDKSGFVMVEPDKAQDQHKICEEKFVKLHETVTKLEDEKNSCLQKALNLEDKVQNMQVKLDTYVQNEVYLGRRLQILHDENDMLAKKQVTLEDKFERIDDIKSAWSMKEASTNSTISWLEQVNRVLQMRVKELENSTNITSQENQRLIESLSFLESRIETIEAKSSHETVKSDETKVLQEMNAVENIQDDLIDPDKKVLGEMNAVENIQDELIDPDKKVLGEMNAVENIQDELIDPNKKLNEPDTKQHDQISVNTTEISQYDPNEERNFQIAPFPIQNSRQSTQTPLTEDSISETTITIDIEPVSQELGLQPPSEQIMQDVEINEEKEELEISSEDSTGGLPLSDAPLIGAPFRLFSFVAKYVAGSDLVSQTGK